MQNFQDVVITVATLPQATATCNSLGFFFLFCFHFFFFWLNLRLLCVCVCLCKISQSGRTQYRVRHLLSSFHHTGFSSQLTGLKLST